MCFCPQDGVTALSLAAQEGKVEVVRVLIEAKALVNLQTKVHVYTVQTMEGLGMMNVVCGTEKVVPLPVE